MTPSPQDSCFVTTLCDTEQDIARWLANGRSTTARAAGVPNQRIGQQSDYQTDLEGVGGELAFCKLVGAWPDLTLTPRHGGIDVNYRGWRIDVKTTSVSSGHLLVKPHKVNDDVDRYVLMVGVFPTYRLAGYTTVGELCQDANLRDFGYGASYALSQQQLTVWPITDLAIMEQF